MLASLARVVFFGKDALAARDAWREVTAALLAVDVAILLLNRVCLLFVDASFAVLLGTVEFLLLLVNGRVSREEIDG